MPGEPGRAAAIVAVTSGRPGAERKGACEYETRKSTESRYSGLDGAAQTQDARNAEPLPATAAYGRSAASGGHCVRSAVNCEERAVHDRQKHANRRDRGADRHFRAVRRGWYQ